MAALKLGTGIGLFIVIVLVVFIGLQVVRMPSYNAPSWRSNGGSTAKLPCLADKQCPMGLKCSNGFCVEAFVGPLLPSSDMSSCSAKECAGINAPCARSETPCGEGTFCQNNRCVDITAPNEGQAYNQIGMLI